MEKTQKPVVQIEDWFVMPHTVNSFQAPEMAALVKLCGRVFGHPRMPDGKVVFTSRVSSLDMKTRTAETHNTIYRLGEPDAFYKAAFPEYFKN